MVWYSNNCMVTQPTMMHSFDSKKTTSAGTMSLTAVLGIIAAAVLLGIGTGYGITTLKSGSTASTKTATKGADKGNKTSAGVKDTKTFPDEAEGTLKKGGFEGEGSFHIERPGGESQNVYLTSTTVDLSTFLNKKVKVWGQTFESEKAGWLMDVGYIEVM